jgi:hypothetical protein
MGDGILADSRGLHRGPRRQWLDHHRVSLALFLGRRSLLNHNALRGGEIEGRRGARGQDLLMR